MKLGWILLALAAILWYANQDTSSTGFQATSALGSLELNYLLPLDNFPAKINTSLPQLHWWLIAIGAYMLWKGRVLRALAAA